MLCCLICCLTNDGGTQLAVRLACTACMRSQCCSHQQKHASKRGGTPEAGCTAVDPLATAHPTACCRRRRLRLPSTPTAWHPRSRACLRRRRCVLDALFPFLFWVCCRSSRGWWGARGVRVREACGPRVDSLIQQGKHNRANAAASTDTRLQRHPPCPSIHSQGAAAWEPQPFELSDMAERLAELCAKAAEVPQYCEYGASGPVQRRVRRDEEGGRHASQPASEHECGHRAAVPHVARHAPHLYMSLSKLEQAGSPVRPAHHPAPPRPAPPPPSPMTVPTWQTA